MNSYTKEQVLAMDADQLDAVMEEVRGVTQDAEMETLQLAADCTGWVEERRQALKADFEKRKELRARIAAGEIGTVVETRVMEERTMTYTPDSKEYRNAWLADLQGKPITAEERTALANGNYVIPTETVNKIYGKLEMYPLLNAVQQMHIPGAVEIPVEGTVNAANIVAMGTAATDSADALAHVALSYYKLIKTVEITADVAAMAVPAFEDWFTDRLANKIFRLATTMCATGSGSSQPTGLTSITASSTTGGTYTKTGITYADLMTIIAALPAEYLPNASFVTSRQIFFGQILGMVDTVGQPVVVRDPQAPGKYNVLGFPVILEDTLNTTGSIVFGDLREGYVWNWAKDVDVARNDSVGFRAGSVVFRGMALADGKPTGVGLVRYVPAP